MKAVTVDLGGRKVTMTRYPTSRSVVPSQLQRDQVEGAELLAFARKTIAEHKARMAHVLAVGGFDARMWGNIAPEIFDEVHVYPKDAYPEVPTKRRAYDAFFQPTPGAGTGYDPRFRDKATRVFGFGGCRHTDDEIRAMAHKVHLREQAALIREAVDNDPAFLGANDPAFRQADAFHLPTPGRGA